MKWASRTKHFLRHCEYASSENFIFWIPGARKSSLSCYKHKGASLLSCLCEYLRQGRANEGPKPWSQTVPRDFTEGGDERHQDSSENLPLIISGSMPQGNMQSPLYPSAASPSSEAQTVLGSPERRGPQRQVGQHFPSSTLEIRSYTSLSHQQQPLGVGAQQRGQEHGLWISQTRAPPLRLM